MNEHIIPSKYITRIDDVDKRMALNRLKNNDIKSIVDKDIAFLDCTRQIDNKPIIQTIDHTYRYIISKLIYLITNIELSESEYKLYVDKIKERHKANIEYEKEHIPIVYNKSKTKVNKQINKEKKTKETKEDNNKALRAALLKTLKFGVKI